MILISLMTNDVEHLLRCLFAIHISAKVSVYSNLLPNFSKLGCLFSYFEFENSLYILGIALHQICNSQIFLPMACLFIFLTMSFEE